MHFNHHFQDICKKKKKKVSKQTNKLGANLGGQGFHFSSSMIGPRNGNGSSFFIPRSGPFTKRIFFPGAQTCRAPLSPATFGPNPWPNQKKKKELKPQKKKKKKEQNRLQLQNSRPSTSMIQYKKKKKKKKKKEEKLNNNTQH